jgi:hypothetical protein
LVQVYKASYGDDSLGREMYQDKLKWWAQDNPQAFEEMLLKEAAARVEKRTGRFTLSGKPLPLAVV